MYKKDNSSSFIIRTSDEAFIPINEGNADYKDYLEWISLGNVPEFIEVPLPSQRPPSSITRRQCAIELREREMITASEALHMTKYGDVPQMISTIISDLPENERILIETDFAADSYLRLNQLLNSLMTAAGASSEDIDQFFISASTR